MSHTKRSICIEQNQWFYLELMLDKKGTWKYWNTVEFDSIKICCSTIQLKGHRIINNNNELKTSFSCNNRTSNTEHRQVHWGHFRAEIFDRFILLLLSLTPSLPMSLQSDFRNRNPLGWKLIFGLDFIFFKIRPKMITR